MAFRVPEKYRITDPKRGGFQATPPNSGNYGAFIVPANQFGTRNMVCLASEGEGWEHVSVHVDHKHGKSTPNWDEMCLIKDLFWDDPEDVVVQYHPRKSAYVTNHPHVLHLWRPTMEMMPEPHHSLVGTREGFKFVLRDSATTMTETFMFNGRPRFFKRSVTAEENETIPIGKGFELPITPEDYAMMDDGLKLKAKVRK